MQQPIILSTSSVSPQQERTEPFGPQRCRRYPSHRGQPFLDGSKSERIRRVSGAFGKAGFKAPVVSDLRAEIWTKLWGNSSFNPISALTHATLEDICKFALTRALAADMMREAQAVGEALGVRFHISLEKRIAGAEAVGAHKTSMLQDIETGRAIEADALIGSVSELGRIVGVATPHIDAIYAVVKHADSCEGSSRGDAGVTYFDETNACGRISR